MISAGQLFEYGIHTEHSDVRAHVSVVDKTVYVFRTKHGVEAIERWRPPVRDAYQPGVTGRTSVGWLVKLAWIADLRPVRFHSWAEWGNFSSDMTTSEKGRLAVRCVIRIMEIGRFPFWINATEDERQNVQVSGTDILVFCKQKVQVKCDWRAGETGNLFLQKAECNPLKRV